MVYGDQIRKISNSNYQYLLFLCIEWYFSVTSYSYYSWKNISVYLLHYLLVGLCDNEIFSFEYFRTFSLFSLCNYALWVFICLCLHMDSHAVEVQSCKLMPSLIVLLFPHLLLKLGSCWTQNLLIPSSISNQHALPVGIPFLLL